MSEIKAVSPLLDGISIGQKISERGGASCYAAMNTDTGETYILKHISIPESQVRVEALLLTGSCKDEAQVKAYYETVVEDLKQELKALDTVGENRGFLPYVGYQIEEKEDGIGFDAYLLGTYRRSLAAYAKKNALTQLYAVNLAMDLCSALAACRKAGYLYLNLRPENIFLQGESNVIGDIGFVSRDALGYTSFPEQYVNSYTAPEVQAIFAPINKTVDIYALGMILYQIYNGGRLPFEDESSPEEAQARRLKGEAFPAPVYADYEMAEIILKACAFQPEERWQNPVEMSKALVAYMQRNEVTDSIIAPPIVTDLPLDASLTEESEIPSDEVPPAEEPEELPEEALASEPDSPSEEEAIANMSLEELLADVTTQLDEAPEAPPAPLDAETTEEISAMLQDTDESAPSEADVDPEAISTENEFSDVLAQADELIQHAAEVAKAEEEARRKELEEKEAQERAEREAREQAEREAEEARLAEQEAQERADAEALAREKRERNRSRKKARITVLVILLILALLGAGGTFYYRNYYCLYVSGMDIVESSQESLTVAVSTKEDPSLLTIRCTDTYGNVQDAPLVDGKATFTGLTPDTQYTITPIAKGFHKIGGKAIQTSYATMPNTEVTNLVALAGQEDGAVILNLTVNGPEPEEWVVTYEAQGEAAQSQVFTGHMTTITGLTVGKSYTFTLSVKSNLALTGTTSLAFTATKVITAENLEISAYTGSSLTATWSQPETPVASWSVRCYNGGDYDVTQEVTDCSATFDGIDSSTAYTVEVTAAGMTIGTHAYVSENPVVITDTGVSSAEEAGAVEVHWEFTGTEPKGWVLLYAFGDSEGATEAAQSDTNTVVLKNLIPNTTYSFQIQTADGLSVFDGKFTADTPEPQAFNAYGITGDSIYMAMFPRPEAEDWSFQDIKNVKYTERFSTQESIAFIMEITTYFRTSEDTVTTTCAVRDSDGKVVDYYSSDEQWYAMWTEKQMLGELERTPQTPGDYTLEIYFNSTLAKTMDFTVTE